MCPYKSLVIYGKSLLPLHICHTKHKHNALYFKATQHSPQEIFCSIAQQPLFTGVPSVLFIFIFVTLSFLAAPKVIVGWRRWVPLTPIIFVVHLFAFSILAHLQKCRALLPTTDHTSITRVFLCLILLYELRTFLKHTHKHTNIDNETWRSLATKYALRRVKLQVKE